MVTKFIGFAFAWYLELPLPHSVCATQNSISFHLISILISKIFVIPFALEFVTINLITLFLLFDSNNFCVVTKAHNYSMQVIHKHTTPAKKRPRKKKKKQPKYVLLFFHERTSTNVHHVQYGVYICDSLFFQRFTIIIML